ncbi:hypothetical protein MBANPS3_009065 [Mucor bainieri]
MSTVDEKLPYNFIQAFAMLYIAIIAESIMLFEAIAISEYSSLVPISEYIKSYIVVICNAIVLCISMPLYFYAYTVKPPNARKKMKIKKGMNANFMLATLSFLIRISIRSVYSDEEVRADAQYNRKLVMSILVSYGGALNIAFSSLHMYLNRNINSANARYDAIKKTDNYDEEDQPAKSLPAFADTFALSPTSYEETAKDT